MPLLDGVQATRIIKELWPEITVVALTLYPDWRSAALEAGADAFMSKGDTPEQVVQLLRAMQTSDRGHGDEAPAFAARLRRPGWIGWRPSTATCEPPSVGWSRPVTRRR